MRSASTWAAAFLAVAFGAVSYIMLFVEPGMGISTAADVLDPDKVAAGYTSMVWRVENLVYFAVPFAVATIALQSNDRIQASSGLAGALLFLVVASIDRVGIQLPSLLATEQDVVAATAAFLPIRFAVLKAAVLSFGVFAWSTTRRSSGAGPLNGAWMLLGWAVLAMCVLFLFVALPVPVALCLWGVGLTGQHLRGSSGEPPLEAEIAASAGHLA